MIAKKLASVAVWMRVFEFQKLLTDLAGAAVDVTTRPAAVSTIVTTATTTISPISGEAIEPSQRARASRSRPRAVDVRERAHRSAAIARSARTPRRTRCVPTRSGALGRDRVSVALRRRADVGERAGADRGEQRRAVRRSFLAIHRAHGHAVDVGLQPADERAARAAAGEQQLLGRQPELLRESTANRAARSTRPRARRASDAPASARGSARRTRRAPTRRDAACARPAGTGGTSRRRRPAGTLAASSLRRCVRVARARELARELVAVPGERAARRQHHAHQVPGVRRDVAERVRAKSRIDARLGRRREHRARRAPARHRLARRDHADAGRAARVVRAAADDRRARREAGERGGLRASRGRGLRPTRPRRAPATSSRSDGVEDLRAPAQPRRVVHQRRRRVGRLGRQRAGQPVANVVLGQQHLGQSRERRRLVIAAATAPSAA